jgi:hypothetical protein
MVGFVVRLEILFSDVLETLNRLPPTPSVVKQQIICSPELSSNNKIAFT